MTWMNRKQLTNLKSEWINGGHFVLSDDDNSDDHEELNKWILNFLDKEITSDEEENIALSIYYSLNFDIPFPATKIARDSLLRIVRMKINDKKLDAFSASTE